MDLSIEDNPRSRYRKEDKSGQSTRVELVRKHVETSHGRNKTRASEASGAQEPKILPMMLMVDVAFPTDQT